jgi:SAM-dependent methyltransferase
VLLAGELRPGQLTLHVAPEPPLARWLSNLSAPGEYLSIDLDGPAMRRMDLTALDLPDASKTLVWCSHVLEHIPDDRKAMREMWRVLRPGGLAVIQVPLRGPTTYEDSSITTPQERRKAFMQEDHVRIYGMDVAGRLQQAGFTVDARSALHLPEALCRLHSLRLLGLNDVFVCTKAL